MSVPVPKYVRRIVRILRTQEGAKLLPALAMFEMTAEQFIALSSIVHRTNSKSVHTHILDHLPFVRDGKITTTGLIVYKYSVVALMAAMQCKYHNRAVNIIIDVPASFVDTFTENKKSSNKSNSGSAPPGRKKNGRKENHHSSRRREEKAAG